MDAKFYRALLGEDAYQAEVKRLAEQIEEHFKDHPDALKEWFRKMDRREHYADDVGTMPEQRLNSDLS
jgi:hypothetical protein